MGARRRLIGAALTGAAVTSGLAVAGPADAAAVTGSKTVYARDDAYTSSVRRTGNFGAADKLVVGRTGSETRLSYVTFATGALPSGATVTGAVLKLPLESRPVAARLSLHPVTGSWSEGRITAANAPAMSAAIATLTPKTTDTVLRFDVSKWVKKPGTYSFALKSAATTAVTRLRAVEYGAATTGGPELALTYTRAATTVPVPSTPPVPPACVTDALLVPTCGVLWGAAAGGFTSTPRDQALKEWEALTGRTASIFHTYHKGDEKFPTSSEIAMSRDPAKPRVLLLNWKVAYNTTWAKVAAGAQNARIDNWSTYVKANYREKFFLALHHEPENDVNPTAGSGMTAKDYAAMYRHVIQRLRANGVTNAVNVLAYMGNEKWMAQSWWKDLYPGDDVVDWLGLDSYVSVEKGYYHYGDMYDLLHRRPTGGGTSWYDWAATAHPAKPVMVAEWGMYHRVAYPTDKAPAFQTVVPVVKAHPQIKAVVYFDTASDNEGDRNIAVNSTPGSLTAFRAIAADPMFNVTVRR
ncbi:CBM96 family carbohydrate-binding protein [Jidongwangia harbinensis]|uniref:CBM96 family carbohydrate-binding protein n=1 Tax=Jidongwangia harbinensis TaxID=2878561 RepID=UPI001CD95703|nr:DNRLRE domain-containing protein [Jidongwangia harbinensis]MCA2213735.1 DNRLRE domain-containing protein [Jidongwangia harbinensis]